MKLPQVLIMTFSFTVISMMAGHTYGQKHISVGPNSVKEPSAEKNCWADIFGDPAFDPHKSSVRLVGPFQASTLEELAGQNWNDAIQSLIVGPNATVHVYRDRDFSGTELIFMSNQRISHELNELDMSHNIESLKIQCRTS